MYMKICWVGPREIPVVGYDSSVSCYPGSAMTHRYNEPATTFATLTRSIHEESRMSKSSKRSQARGAPSIAPRLAHTACVACEIDVPAFIGRCGHVRD